MKKKALVVIFGALSSMVYFSNAVAATDADADLIIKTMNNEEKSRFVTGTGMNNAEKVPGAAGSTLKLPYLGIPQIVFADGPVGVRLGAGPTGGEARYSTAFPISSSLSSTWNTDLIYQVALSMGEEAKSFGVDVLLGPAVNLQRNPLNGRNFEYFSEDPFLSGRIGAAFVQGIQSTGVGATVKHFIANNQESYRQYADLGISERTLRELYLASFEYIVKQTKPWAVMSSYPSINGTFASQNHYLLTQILRDEWGYDGLVMSDWYAVKEPAKAIMAGNDLIMPGGVKKDAEALGEDTRDPSQVVLAALNSGELKQEQIDLAIKRILTLIKKTAIYTGNGATADKANFDQHATVARRAAAEGMVLLKNENNVLPLAEKSRIALFEVRNNQFYISGGGSAAVNVDPNRISLLKPALEEAGFNLIKNVMGREITEFMTDLQMAEVAKTTDVAIVVLSRFSTEGADRYSMSTKQNELDLIRKVSRYYHKAGKRVIVLLNVGEPIETSYWSEDADAILLTWQPGQEAGHAIVDILSGKVSPSGKLPLTFPKRIMDAPTYTQFPGNPKSIVYGEGIYMGYRYYDAKQYDVSYPFGHGLSYVNFRYSNIRTETPQIDLDRNDSFTLSVDVTNEGNMPAQEVVQLYLYDIWASVDRPFQELKGFKKILLQPAETQTVSFTLDKRALSFFDPMKNDWFAEPGKFVARIGSSSRDIRLEQIFSAVAKTPVITMDTPWLTIQTNERSAEILARFIGDNETNGWVSGLPTLGEKLNQILKERYSNDKDRQDYIDRIINTLVDEL